MPKVGAEQRGGGAPQLRPKDAGNADVIVATITDIKMQPSQFKMGDQIVLLLKEFPEHSFRLGKRSVDNMCAAISDDTDDWKDEQVVLVRRFEQMAKNSGGDGYVYQVAPPDEWKELIKKSKRASK